MECKNLSKLLPRYYSSIGALFKGQMQLWHIIPLVDFFCTPCPSVSVVFDFVPVSKTKFKELNGKK